MKRKSMNQTTNKKMGKCKICGGVKQANKMVSNSLCTSCVDNRVAVKGAKKIRK